MGIGIWAAGEYANWGPTCQAIKAGSYRGLSARRHARLGLEDSDLLDHGDHPRQREIAQM